MPPKGALHGPPCGAARHGRAGEPLRARRPAAREDLGGVRAGRGLRPLRRDSAGGAAHGGPAGARQRRTAFLAPEGAVYADQVLLAGIVQPALTSAGERDAQSRRDCAEAFFAFLLGEVAQAGLVQAQLFSATGAGPLYEAGTPMGALEASLAGDLELAPGFAALAAK